MAYQDNYKMYLEHIPEDIETCIKTGKRHIFGYTSNLDVVVEWNVETFNKILSKYLKEEPSAQEGETIDSIEDFARIVSYYTIKGFGGEVDATNVQVYDYLEKKFKTELALGGTCAQGAAALNAIGFPAIAHLTDKSKEVRERIDSPGIYMVLEKGLIPIGEAVMDSTPTRHVVLQYPKDDKIIANGLEYCVPVSNRIIIDYDLIHKYLPIDGAFLNYCEDHADDIYSYSISGFNAIVDSEILKDRLAELGQHYSKIKEENPSCILYLESAHYLNSVNKVTTFNEMARYIDILGMNEEELVDLTQQIGVFVDKDNLESILNGLEVLTENYSIKGIVMHTKDYSMYYGEGFEDIDIEKGLTLGNLMSATRARTGCYGSYEECAESLSLELSQIGLNFAEQLEGIATKKNVLLVPSRYMEHPKYTIGLGDTFVAGMQICFIR